MASEEKSITAWATQELSAKLSNLPLNAGVATQELSAGFVSGEVSVTERKGKNIPIYSLEVEVPFEGTIGGVACKGLVKIPDLSLEVLDDLEVEFDIATGDSPEAAAALEGGADAVRDAVRAWASTVRKAVSSDLSSVPLDPPSKSRTPRAAALISEEEAMSAGGAGELDDGIEEIPRADEEGEGGEEEEAPFEEEEVVEMYQQAREMLREVVQDGEVEEQLKELDAELAGKDLQERGRILVDVLNFLENGGEGEEGEEGYEEEGYEGEEGGGRGGPRGDGGEYDEGEEGVEGEGEEVEYEPYRGEEELRKLWDEVVGLCAAEDVPRLEEEVKGKSPEEQWRTLQDVRTYLLEGDEDEQVAFEEWQPTIAELDEEWGLLMGRVPPEEAKEVAEDYEKANPEEKKRMVWDVKKFLDEGDIDEEEGGEEEEGEEEGGAARPPPPKRGGKPPPGPPPTDAELASGRNEGPRRRGGGRAHMEYGFDAADGAARDPGEWDEYYSKEMRKGGGKKGSAAGGSGALFYGALAAGLSVAALLVTAAVLADENEGLLASASRLLFGGGGGGEMGVRPDGFGGEAAEFTAEASAQ